ncbi:hypothetical protein GCM10008090_30420 [Arenicella chitinivorans]|uniref:Glycosyl transferase family 1 domain-containing protein n=1 Tax=Arenicella chitinivorans TaxID=1329800 RepID=A0A918S1E7_9GAMM|nr:glycosyltransferase [Arenicella chitinivorans]GHA18728.1 hypothetical protein GCM10008090_30420 [Arenicella chitinivorans]
MNELGRLHFALMCNRSNGGFFSGLTLIDELQPYVDLCVWNLVPQHDDSLLSLFANRSLTVNQAQPCIELEPGDHVFFYMNEYPTLWRNFSRAWQSALCHADSIQIAFNRTVGAMPLETWLAPHLTHLYFQDTHMHAEWRTLVKGTGLRSTPVSILPPPVNISGFLTTEKHATKNPEEPVIIGRLAGDGDVPENAIDFYTELATALPEAVFWFMPAPTRLAEALQGHPQFHFFAPNEISPLAFLRATDIYLLTYAPMVPIPGPRSLVEAMAAQCAPVVVNRDGPQRRVVHGKSGFCFDTDLECRSHVAQLVRDPTLRERISKAAHARALSFKLSDWTDQILQYCAADRKTPTS